MCYDATDGNAVCLAGMLVKSSVYMGIGWFGSAVLPLMSAVRAFVNRLFASGVAGFDVISVAPKIKARHVDRGCSRRIKTWIFAF